MSLKLLKKKNNLKKINLIDIDFKQVSGFDKITTKSNNYIASCFDVAIKLLKNNVSNKFINGPISKKTFLKKNTMELLNILPKKLIQKNLQ